MATAADSAGRPPRARCTLAVGVTGHRAAALPAGAEAAIATRLETVLAGLAAATVRLHAAHGWAFADAPPTLRFISALADGADQLGATAALAGGYQLQAVLPFARDAYAATMPADAAVQLSGLLDRATCIFELPGSGAAQLDAFVMAGRATVAHSDLLIAVWDGLPARGRGGTGEVVEHALRCGAPVLHLPVDPDQPLAVMWSGFDSFVTHARNDEVPVRPYDAAAPDTLLAALLAPPDDGFERACLAAFHAEPQRRLRMRVEYPLLLACTGARPLKRGSIRVAPFAATTRADWSNFRTAVDGGHHGVSTPLDGIEAAFCWSDGLAQHFAQTYRSGHVFNFVLAAAAVLLALSGLLMKDVKLWLAIAELVAVVAFVVNTRVGTQRAWQRRWLDYRQLAERLRPLRSLKLLGIAEPDRRSAAGSDRQRWIDWYATRVWRSDGCASGSLADDRAAAVTAFVVTEELLPQIAYHRANAGQIRHLDHRLHQAGMVLFVASIISCLAFIAAYFIDKPWVVDHAAAFVFLSAGLPALGSALFGIRMQGDFGGTADRSLATATRLEWIAAAIAGRVGLPRAADLLEATARTMVADLAEWRLSHQQRRLEIPG